MIERDAIATFLARRAEFDALPEWAQKMVRAAASRGYWGMRHATNGNPEPYLESYIGIKTEAFGDWTDGLDDLLALADAVANPDFIEPPST